jgi:hypothetical protein
MLYKFSASITVQICHRIQMIKIIMLKKYASLVKKNVKYLSPQFQIGGPGFPAVGFSHSFSQ